MQAKERRIVPLGVAVFIPVCFADIDTQLERELGLYRTVVPSRRVREFSLMRL